MTPRRPRGFTLIEVVIALVITGLVVTLAYAAVQGGLDTRDRLARQREQREALITVRAMIRDALRHALPGVPGGPEVFSLVNRVTTRGVSTDSVTFLTRGVSPPYGTSAAWRVTVNVDTAGLHFVAAPGSGAGGEMVMAVVPGVTGLDVQATGRGMVSSWRSDWSDPSVAPQGATFSFSDAAGGTQPLVARLSLERNP
ncbi:MAG: type II secretion system protein [Cytophagaceae bacterium]|nr:type II secretion system protein [Gemmatimonadaceae bacterium]